MRVRPREPAVSVLGRFMVTAVSADVVAGGVFLTRSLAETVVSGVVTE